MSWLEIFILRATVLAFWVFILRIYITSKIHLDFERTFWMKRIIGLEIWIDNQDGSATNYGFTWGIEREDEFQEYQKKGEIK